MTSKKQVLYLGECARRPTRLWCPPSVWGPSMVNVLPLPVWPYAKMQEL